MSKSSRGHFRTPSINLVLSEQSKNHFERQSNTHSHENFKQERLLNLNQKYSQLKTVFDDTLQENQQLKSNNIILKQKLSQVNQDLSTFFTQIQLTIKKTSKNHQLNQPQLTKSIFERKHTKNICPKTKRQEILTQQYEHQNRNLTNRKTEDSIKENQAKLLLGYSSSYLQKIPTLRQANYRKPLQDEFKLYIKTSYLEKDNWKVQQNKKEKISKMLIKQQIDKMWQRGSKKQQKPLLDKLYEFQTTKKFINGFTTPISSEVFDNLSIPKVISSSSSPSLKNHKTYLSSHCSTKFH